MDFKKIKSGFTLVELIIVVTVLAILATIAFVSFQSYTANARDSVRAVNLKDLSKAIELHKISTGKFPKPGDVYATGQLLGTNLFTVGKINSDLSKLLKFSKTPVDPVSGSEYLYGLNYNNKYFEVAGTFESQQASFFVGKAHADIGKYFSRIEGNYKGLMLFSTGSQQYIANIPSLIFSREGTYELIGNEVYFITHNGKNFAYSVDGQTTIQNQTVEEVLAQKTGKNVQVDYLEVQDWEDDSEQFVDRLGYQKDLIGFEIFGKSYEPTGEIGGEDEEGGDEYVPPVDISNPLKFSYIDAGIYHTCGVSTEGAVYCWGGGANSLNLGNRLRELRYYPVQVSGLTSGYVRVSAGYYSTCVLSQGGGVKCWGKNSSGLLGSGNSDDAFETYIPQNVVGLESGVIDIKVGESHACALLSSGTVKCWGQNTVYQLGDGTEIDSSTPVSVIGLTGVTEISAGLYHTCALISDGGVKCWGGGYYGQLGNGDNSSGLPVSVSGISNAISVSVSGRTSCALLSTGDVKCWGYNEYGILGDGTQVEKNSPVNVIGVSGVTHLDLSPYGAIAKTGSGVMLWGKNPSRGTNLTAINDEKLNNLSILQISTGSKVSCVILSNNITQCRGFNGYGGVGVFQPDVGSIDEPTTIPFVNDEELSYNIFKKVAVGKNHSCGISWVGFVLCWGDNSFGQLGNGNNVSSKIPLQIIGEYTEAEEIFAGDNFTCVKFRSTGLHCWGDNSFGQLGDGTNNSSNIPIELSDFTGLVGVGDNFVCGTNYMSEVMCWGDNTYGQLGDGTNTNRNLPTQVNFLQDVNSIAVGGDFVCLKTEESQGIYCWGKNDKGQLGVGNVISTSTPTLIPGTEGLDVGYLGVGTDFACYSSSVHNEETDEWTSGDYCWGDNSFGQYGNGNTVSSLSPVLQTGIPSEHSISVFENTLRSSSWSDNSQIYVVGDNSFGQYGNNSTISFSNFQPITNEYAQLSFGNRHGCGITENGVVKCWGDNTYGQLGDDTYTSSTTSVLLKTR